MPDYKSFIPSWKFVIKCNTSSCYFMCKKVSVCGGIAVPVNMKQLLEDTVWTHLSIYAKFMIDDILLTVNMLSFAKPLNSSNTGYFFEICGESHQTPLKKRTVWGVSEWGRTSETLLRICQSPFYNVTILLNSANVTLSSFFPCVKNTVSIFPAADTKSCPLVMGSVRMDVDNRSEQGLCVFNWLCKCMIISLNSPKTADWFCSTQRTTSCPAAGEETTDINKLCFRPQNLLQLQKKGLKKNPWCVLLQLCLVRIHHRKTFVSQFT